MAGGRAVKDGSGQPEGNGSPSGSPDTRHLLGPFSILSAKREFHQLTRCEEGSIGTKAINIQ